MGELIVSLAGTREGELLALALTLLSAVSHATFGAINKGGADPFLNRGAINLTYGLAMAPVALLVVPWPSGIVWAALAAAFVVHLVYEWFQARSFETGDFTLVYPIARGTGPLATLALAVVVFGEEYGSGQWAGAALLSASILGLAWANVAAARAEGRRLRGLRTAILAALATGGMIAIYTTVDAWGIRQAADPFTFLAWFFFLGMFGFPLVALHRWRGLAEKPALGPLAVRGVFGAVIAVVSFGSIMLATRVGKVGEVAALREISIIFGTAIGVLVFREAIDARRLALIGLIAAGAVLVEVG